MRLLHCLALACCTDALAPTTSTTRRQLDLSLAAAKRFYPRITRSVRGRVHDGHHTKPATCAAANVHAGRIRQLLIRDKERPIETLTNASACRKAVHGSDAPAKRCPYTSGASEHRAEGRGPKAVKLVPLKEGSLS